MTIIEALTLAKDKPGTKVRPLSWEVEYIEYREDVAAFVTLYEGKVTEDSVEFFCQEDLLGDWEEVK